MQTTNRPGFYVMDRFAHDVTAAIMAGPFDTKREADRERKQLNIADDCIISRLSALGIWRDA